MTTSTTRSRRELAEQALTELGMLAAGQTAGTEELATVDAKIDPLLARLAAKGIVEVPDTEEIPIAMLQPLAELLAEDCGGWAGKGKDPKRVMLAEMELRLVNRPEPTGERSTAEYF